MNAKPPAEAFDVQERLERRRRSDAQVREEHRRLREESERVSERFLSTKASIHDTWERLVRNQPGAMPNRDLRRAALNLLEDTERAGAAERVSEARYRTLFESIDEAFCIIEVLFDRNDNPLDYRFLEANPAFQRHTGLENAVGRTMRELLPDNEEHWFVTYGRIALTGQPERFECRVAALRRDFDIYAFRTGEPHERKVAMLFRDITARKRQDANLALLAAVSQELVRHTSVEEAMNVLGAKIGLHFCLSLCAFVEIDEAAEAGIVEHSWHQPDVPGISGIYRIRDFVTPEFQRALRAGETVVVRDTSADPRTKATRFADLKIGSFIAVPVTRGGQWRFCLGACGSESHDWREDEVELLRELTTRIWTRLERARAEEGRREAEERYLALFNSMEQGFCTIEVAFDDNQQPLDYRFVEVSPSFERQTGIASAAGRWMREIVPDQDQFWFDTYGYVALTGEPLRFESHSTPLERWWSVYAFRVADPALRRIAVFFHDITDRKRAEEALRKTAIRLRTLADAVPQIIWTNTGDGLANWFNSRWHEYSGLTFEQSVGAGWQNLVHPEDALPSKGRWQQALAAGEIFECEYRLRAADGSYRWFIGRNVPLRGDGGEVIEWFGTATDIQALKEAEAAAIKSEEQLRLMLENAREYAIFSLDLNRCVTSWNRGAERMLGYRESEILGNTADVIYMPEDRAAGQPEAEAREALARGRATDERWHVRKDGSRFWASGSMMVMRERGGAVVGLLKIFRDQTEAKQSAEALARSQAELAAAFLEMQRAREEAEEAGRAKDRFLAMLSHELRTPLTPVLGAAESILRQKDLSARTVEGLKMICRNVELQAHLINDLLDLTRISHGKLELVCEEMNLHDAVKAAVEVSLSDIQGKHQELKVDLSARDSVLYADPARTQQVFWNLLKNASKFTPDHGKIRLVSRNEPGAIVIEITDTGIGIEPQALSQIFEPFRQGDTSITRRFGGLGLGLAISKATIEAHGGSIAAASGGPGQGATFSVRFPLGALHGD
jgi:PAS domain S-box-containing protein